MLDGSGHENNVLVKANCYVKRTESGGGGTKLKDRQERELGGGGGAEDKGQERREYIDCRK